MYLQPCISDTNAICVIIINHFLKIWFPFTHTDESRGSKVFIRVHLSVCLSVCLRDRTKTAEIAITKLAMGIVHHYSWLPV